MDPKYKTVIPLLIGFFIFGVVVGYVAHKPETIETIVEKERIVTVTVTVTPTPVPQQTEEIVPKESPVVQVPDIIKLDGTFVAARTITIKGPRYGGIDPNPTSLRQNEIALFKLYEIFQYQKAMLQIGQYNFEIKPLGGVFLKFTEKRTYNYKVIIPSNDPNIQPITYAEGTITVY